MSEKLKVTFKGCSDEQVNWGGGEDPRKLLKKGQEYEVVRTKMYDWHTHYFIEVDGKELPFGSGCFGDWEEEKIELPKKLTTIIADTDHAFVVRIGAEPRISDTGIANIIPINRDVSRQGRDRTIKIAKHLVSCWNAFEDNGLVAKLVGACRFAVLSFGQSFSQQAEAKARLKAVIAKAENNP